SPPPPLVEGFDARPPSAQVFARMGNLLRLAVLILALGALAAGTGLMLLKERGRERNLERLLVAGRSADADISADEAAFVSALRRHHTLAQRATLFFGGLAIACVVVVAIIPPRPPRAPVE